VCKEAKKGKEEGTKLFLSSGKHLNNPRGKINLDDFQKDVLRRNLFEYFDRGEFPAAMKVTQVPEEKIAYKLSVRRYESWYIYDKKPKINSR
jgi:hypothetical protein